MKTIFGTLATIAVLMSSPAAADTVHSANYFLPACRDFANGNYVNNPLQQGECIGIIEGLAAFAVREPFETNRSCVPDDVTISQVTTVVVRWMDQHPQRWHENFFVLVLLALHEAWPCK
jgi:hypothetical protein